MSRTLKGHMALFLRGPWNRSLIPMPWGWVGEGWSAPRCLDQDPPFFRATCPSPELSLQTPAPQLQMRPSTHRPLRGRPLGMRLGRGRGRGRGGLTGAADAAAQRAHPPARRGASLAPPSPGRSSSAPPPGSPRPPSNPKVKIAVSAVCTSLNAGCTVPPSARPPEGPRRLRLRSPRPQTLCPPESRTSGFAVEQGETQSWPQEVSGLW